MSTSEKQIDKRIESVDILILSGELHAPSFFFFIASRISHFMK